MALKAVELRPGWLLIAGILRFRAPADGRQKAIPRAAALHRCPDGQQLILQGS